ncbi:histidine phosphatase family protein [Reyranella sp.]|uniref:histidine phosphatase family protein n=1 Tax=Reyranella sp. TaxID=1929291 RepID=UPI003D12A44C
MNHFTLFTNGLEATKTFYAICGLKPGPRPPLNVPGVWPRLLGRAEFCLALLAALFLIAGQSPTLAQADAWTSLRQPGHVVFVRHAVTAGGFGDPPGYRLDDCASQRNLTDAGRAQARRTGEAFMARGLTFDRVLSSPWCRCMETAKLLTGRDPEPMDALSNLVGRAEHREHQVMSLRAYLAGQGSASRVLFSTHGILINALVGINPAEGEMVIVKAGVGGEPRVVGRLRVE